MIAPRRGWLGLVLIACLTACNNQKPPAAPARFEQPNSVDFVCVVKDEVRPLAECPPALVDEDHVMHALVTQASRGEVAAVDFASSKVLDSRRDIPGFTFVPVGELPVAIVVPPNHPELSYVAEFGSRDVRVLRTQELVTPLNAGDAEVQVVPLTAPSASGSVAAAPTRMLLAPDENALIVAVPDQGRVMWLPILRCADDGDTSCDDYGRIDTDNIASIDLAASTDRIAQPPAPAKAAAPYGKLCGFPQATPATAPDVTLSDEMLDHAPRPSGLALDAFCIGDSACTRRILVSDEALPLIHAIDLDAIAPGTDGSDGLLAPIVTGVATRAVAVTPHVPVTVGNDEATQYVYAIDATDGSVLVTENDRLINVNAAPSARPDRIELTDWLDVGTPPAAAALTVLHPSFNVDEPVGQYVFGGAAPANSNTPDRYCTDDENHPEEDPARLRGVFLAIATTDGSVRIVDVHDMELFDAGAKGGDGEGDACRKCPNDVRAPAVLRNHERLQGNFITEEGEDVQQLTPEVGTFAFAVDGLLFNVRPDGTSGSPDAPSLDCMACERNQSVVFPEPAEDSDDEEGSTDVDGGTALGFDRCAGATPALLCAGADPWKVSVNSWAATYESAIPGAAGSDAVFIAPGDPANLTGSPEVLAPTDFCSVGVLGDDAIAAAYTGDECNAEADPPTGDQIQITTPLLGDVGLDQLKAGEDVLKMCDAAREALKDDATLAPRFAIRRAYRDRLVIEEGLLQPVGTLRTYKDLQQCLGDRPMTYFVRTRDSFLVAQHLNGLPQTVAPDGAGRCVVEKGADPLARGRARLGCTFRNHAFTFRMRKPGKDDPVDEPPAGLSLAIRMLTPASKLICNLGSLGFGGAASVVPVQLRYNQVDQYLYLVDIQDRGLVPITLDAFPPGIDSSFF